MTRTRPTGTTASPTASANGATSARSKRSAPGTRAERLIAHLEKLATTAEREETQVHAADKAIDRLIGAVVVLALAYMVVEGWWEQAFTRLL